MGLAAYGTPRPDTVDFVQWDRRFPRIDRKRFRAFLGRAPTRRPGEEILQEHKDLASTAQWVLERAVIGMARALHEETGIRALVLGGGIALNCSMNGALLSQDFLDDVFVNPAAHDAGTALGAAAWVHRELTGTRPECTLRHPFFGPAFDSAAVEAVLRDAGITSSFRVQDPEEEAAKLLASGKIIGWFQGRMEFGPRALGNRSILADPGKRETADRVNDIKGRERWRPLAPSIPLEDVGSFVNGTGPIRSPFMLMAFQAGEDQPRFWNLLRRFEEKTGRAVLLNTSFNLAGQPIVCTPRDALGTFFASGLDALVMEDFLVWK